MSSEGRAAEIQHRAARDDVKALERALRDFMVQHRLALVKAVTDTHTVTVRESSPVEDGYPEFIVETTEIDL